MHVEEESKNENNFMGAISEIDLEANDTTPESMKHLLRFPIGLIDKLNLSVSLSVAMAMRLLVTIHVGFISYLHAVNHI